MFCVKCQTDLSECSCPDLEERLMTVPNFVFKACVQCGKHYARCRCPNPEFTVVGKDPVELTDPKENG